MVPPLGFIISGLGVACLFLLLSGILFLRNTQLGRLGLLVGLWLHLAVLIAWLGAWVWSNTDISYATTSPIFIGPVAVSLVTIFGIWVFSDRNTCASSNKGKGT